MEQELLDRYLDGICEVEKAFDGIEDALMHRVPADGSWTIHQNLVHILDADLIMSDRMKRIASTDTPLLIGFNQSGFAELPGSSLIPVKDAITIFQKNRSSTALILKHLPPDSWSRCGVHNEVGLLSLREIAQKTVSHLKHHLEVVEKKKKLFQA